MNIYLVEDVGNSPGTIYVCLSSQVDADLFCEQFNEANEHTYAVVVERTLFYGQPGHLGFNK